MFLKPGEAWGDVDPSAVQRQMIHRTIKEHLEKEKRLRPLGIKVLSLFFIDAVAKYRQCDADGTASKGEYAKMFEEEYRRLARHPDYQSLFKELDMEHPVEDVHNGYFSSDRKKVAGKTVEVFKDTTGATKAVLQSAEFKALWDRIKYRTTYRVQFDNEKLIQDCIKAVEASPRIARARLHWRKAELAIGRGGVEAGDIRSTATVALTETDIVLPDVLTDLQDRTQLTRRSIQRILAESNRLEDFKHNPQQFIEQTAEVINRCKRLALVDGIRYQRIGDGAYYAQELFSENELRGYLTSMIDARKAVYERVVYDSDVERDFARDLESNEAIKVYAKLPGWFKVETPLGTYNPDWAIVVDVDGAERLYFVVETKSSLFTDALRPIEEGKIKCGKAHFQALAVGDSPARYVVKADLESLLAEAD